MAARCVPLSISVDEPLGNVQSAIDLALVDSQLAVELLAEHRPKKLGCDMKPKLFAIALGG